MNGSKSFGLYLHSLIFQTSCSSRRDGKVVAFAFITRLSAVLGVFFFFKTMSNFLILIFNSKSTPLMHCLGGKKNHTEGLNGL